MDNNFDQSGIPPKMREVLETKLTATQGVAVADAVGTEPTKAEYNTLLASLRTAGIIATTSK